MLCSRTRNDLAEALDLLKAQIPNHNQTQGGSASGSPEREDKMDTGKAKRMDDEWLVDEG